MVRTPNQPFVWHFESGVTNTAALSLRTTVVEGSESTAVEHRYHVTRYTATGLPTSDDRNILNTQDTEATFSEAEVVLAFPSQWIPDH